MTTQHQPLDTAAIQAALNTLGPDQLWNDGHMLYTGENGVPAASTWIGDTCNVSLPDHGEANAAAIVTIHNAMPALLARVAKLTADLDEMTHCRDNAIRALHRDDIETDIDVEQTITDALCGPGWDWEDDRTPSMIACDVAPAIRPALAKACEQRNQALARVAELERQLAAHQIALAAAPTSAHGAR